MVRFTGKLNIRRKGTVMKGLKKVGSISLIMMLTLSLVITSLPTVGYATATDEQVGEIEDEETNSAILAEDEEADAKVETLTEDVIEEVTEKDVEETEEEIEVISGDGNPPVLESIEIDRQEVNAGDTVKITAKVTDDVSGVKSVSIQYKSPSQSRKQHVKFNRKDTTGLWEARYEIDELDEEGIWTLDYISVFDHAGNSKIYRQKDLETDLSYEIKGSENDNPSKEDDEESEDDKTEDESLPYLIVNSNETWINKVINEDVFIGPDAVLSVFGNVIIRGDVYVYWALQSAV